MQLVFMSLERFTQDNLDPYVTCEMCLTCSEFHVIMSPADL